MVQYHVHSCGLKTTNIYCTYIWLRAVRTTDFYKLFSNACNLRTNINDMQHTNLLLFSRVFYSLLNTRCENRDVISNSLWYDITSHDFSTLNRVFSRSRFSLVPNSCSRNKKLVYVTTQYVLTGKLFFGWPCSGLEHRLPFAGHDSVKLSKHSGM